MIWTIIIKISTLFCCCYLFLLLAPFCISTSDDVQFAIAPLVGGALITGGASLLSSVFGGLFGKSSSNAAADAALQAQRETNQTNLQLAREQNEWNLAQWNRENAYNTPANQKKLLMDAGLNPVLAQGNFTPANQLTSADLANQSADGAVQAANLRAQGGQMFGSSIASGVKNAADTYKAYVEAQRAKAQAGAITQLTPVQIDLYRSQINKFIADTKTEDMLRDVRFNEILEHVNLLREQIPLIKSQKDRTDLETDLLKIDKEIKDAAKDWLKKLPKAQYNAFCAQAYQAWQQGDLSKFVLKWEKEHGRTLPTNTLDQLFNYIFGRITGNDDGSIFDDILPTPNKLSNYLGNKTDAHIDNTVGIGAIGNKLR